eukprot:TRINITY_DN26008_c0_g1_i2.p1 TRINITY_DN26008_c0_g1~~TRINITY_DN26008_c0_g1_i2.p1  ORF type:complete len:593 (-),score=111.89 TRINITY_DN26008_c0_g1_i2:104-1882(-)
MPDASLVSWERGFGDFDDYPPSSLVPSGASPSLSAQPSPPLAPNDASPSFSSSPAAGGSPRAGRSGDLLPPPPWASNPGVETRPPVRLRMRCADMLCRRSMEVAWTDGRSGARQTWTSWTDPVCGWFEAEKILPSSAADIRVHFLVHTVVTTWDVCAIDRHSSEKTWVDSVGPEVICLRSEHEDEVAPVDAVFELAGPATHCYIWRAWNAVVLPPDLARGPWECWEDEQSRPGPEGQPEVLVAADAAASVSAGALDPVLYCANATWRLVAAARVLLEIRKKTLEGLRSLDEELTSQWYAVNSANTMSAGLGVMAAVSIVLATPLSFGLAMGSAAVGGGACAGDALADHFRTGELRRQLSHDARNSFAVAELEREWVWARQNAIQSLQSPLGEGEEAGIGAIAQEEPSMTVYGAQVGATVAKVLGVAADEVSCASRAAAATASSAKVSKVALDSAATARVLGVAGAALSIGIAVHGWSTTKALQQTVRSQLNDVAASTIRIQEWLATTGSLQCALCRCGISLAHEVGRCWDSWHYFHAECLEHWRRRRQCQECTCPTCSRPLAQQVGVLAELLAIERARLTGAEESAIVPATA